MEFICEQDLKTMNQHKNHVQAFFLDVIYYYNFSLGKIVTKLEGLVYSSTVLGWVLSGPIIFRNSCFTNICFEIHSMLLQY